MNFDAANVCRTCLSKENLVNLYPEREKESNIEATVFKDVVESIKSCYNIEISPSDMCSTNVCGNCIRLVKLLQTTKLYAQSSDSLLRGCVLTQITTSKTETSQPAPATVETPVSASDSFPLPNPANVEVTACVKKSPEPVCRRKRLIPAKFRINKQISHTLGRPRGRPPKEVLENGGWGQTLKKLQKRAKQRREFGQWVAGEIPDPAAPPSEDEISVSSKKSSNAEEKADKKESNKSGKKVIGTTIDQRNILPTEIRREKRIPIGLRSPVLSHMKLGRRSSDPNRTFENGVKKMKKMGKNGLMENNESSIIDSKKMLATAVAEASQVTEYQLPPTESSIEGKDRSTTNNSVPQKIEKAVPETSQVTEHQLPPTESSIHGKVSSTTKNSVRRKIEKAVPETSQVTEHQPPPTESSINGKVNQIRSNTKNSVTKKIKKVRSETSHVAEPHSSPTEPSIIGKVSQNSSTSENAVTIKIENVLADTHAEMYKKVSKLMEKCTVAKGDNNYYCKYCDVTLGRKRMMNHIKFGASHLKYRPYHCTECGIGFRAAAHLRDHFDSRHRSVKYPCKTCGTSFTTSAMMESHTEIFHRET